MRINTENISRTEYIILRSLSESPKTYWDLLLESFDTAANTINSIKNLLNNNTILYKNNYFYLSEENKEIFKNILKIEYKDVKCKGCNGKGFINAFNGISKEFGEIIKDRPKAIPEFDQGVVNIDTVISRITFMYYKGDLENRDIVLIGDDDLTSIALSLTNLPNKVIVLEADKRLVDYINDKSRKLGLDNLKAISYNVEWKVDNSLRNSFDVFLTDPVETVQGISLFISRGCSMLKSQGVLYFGLTHIEASYKKWYKIHKNLYEMNFVITDILDKFQLYELNPDDIVSKGYRVFTEIGLELPKPEKPWYNSAFHRLELIDKPNPLFDPDKEYRLERDLYYDDEAYVTLY
ncbi:MAG: bis-aminopropyl spermidine synthase family protein [Candidatus Calescibacterium sp.]|nr:bis-aminopropyl spermidine synthase family protein [Candidatus Calescibacterium sp.]MDW8132670.1 bis-aminopropyl spermidine synthase family protein [Candidatus Calescibacterium sp.]